MIVIALFQNPELRPAMAEKEVSAEEVPSSSAVQQPKKKKVLQEVG